MSGTSWLLGGGYPWHSDPGLPNEPGALVANPRTGLALASLAAGPLGLGSPDGSLGRLTLPRGIAVDGDALFVLSQEGDLVYRYDALHETLAPLAHIGSQGLCGAQDPAVWREPRRFRRATAIAALRGALDAQAADFAREPLRMARREGGKEPPPHRTTPPQA